MSPHLIRDIASLKRSLASLGGEVEKQIEEGIKAFTECDVLLAKRVVAADKRIDAHEVEIEEEILKTLALYQPRAADLRFMIVALKVNNELERAGDYASTIAQRALVMAKSEPVILPSEIEVMSKRASAMLRKSLDALLDLDTLLAKELRIEDDEVDDLNEEVFLWVKTQLRDFPALVDPLLSISSVSRLLERIADIATNIAEDVIYLVEGYIARHTRPELAPMEE